MNPLPRDYRIESARGEQVRLPGDGALHGGHVEKRPGVGEAGDGLQRVLRDAEQRGGTRVDPCVDHAVVDVADLGAGTHAAQLGVADLMIGEEEEEVQKTLLIREEVLVRLDFVPRDRTLHRHGQFRDDGAGETRRDPRGSEETRRAGFGSSSRSGRSRSPRGSARSTFRGWRGPKTAGKCR